MEKVYFKVCMSKSFCHFEVCMPKLCCQSVKKKTREKRLGYVFRFCDCSCSAKSMDPCKNSDHVVSLSNKSGVVWCRRAGQGVSGVNNRATGHHYLYATLQRSHVYVRYSSTLTLTYLFLCSSTSYCVPHFFTHMF